MSTPQPPAPPPWSPPPAPPRRRESRGWDVALTVVELVVLTLVTVVVSISALLFGVFDCFSDNQCVSGGRVARGAQIAGWSPWLWLLVAVVASVALLATRRLAWWVPWLAGAATLATWFLGAAVATGDLG